MYRFKRLVAIVGLVATMAIALAPAGALAQSSTEAYGGGNVVAGLEQGGGGDGTTPVAADDGGSLPFTGADLGVLAAAGGMLLALGFGLRRLTHRPTDA